ncbi:lasso peptide biosynthesis B2 protein [Streptomyces sp. B6B3]|uniref:lasso peptide biosynthesis B2 protein n=1 Tax=Streptomyces sp. B6B3 TaxID=3153570 RepID=UPI00325CBC6A
MSQPIPLARGPRLPLRRRLAALLAVTAARLLAGRPPRRITVILRALRRGSTAATAEQAAAARGDVTAVSTLCAGEGCLQRSLATVLLCRLHGTWPAWCTGVRTDPFTAHAWVEVDGHPVGEPTGPGYYTPVIVVPPLTPPASRPVPGPGT